MGKTKTIKPALDALEARAVLTRASAAHLLGGHDREPVLLLPEEPPLADDVNGVDHAERGVAPTVVQLEPHAAAPHDDYSIDRCAAARERVPAAVVEANSRAPDEVQILFGQERKCVGHPSQVSKQDARLIRCAPG